MHIDELDTPAVVIDIDVMDRNLARFASYCREHKLSLRPHTKTHKIPQLARKQLDLGATGITVAKAGEAEVMVDSGIKDILIAYPIATKEKARRLASLA
jgi:D-serine deaminase-like pyridoxal phosphate-dependent protein